jgi:hypothetical protein
MHVSRASFSLVCRLIVGSGSCCVGLGGPHGDITQPACTHMAKASLYGRGKGSLEGGWLAIVSAMDPGRAEG